MGEYFVAVNVTQRQYIHPHDLGEGAKKAEWVDNQDSDVWKQARARWSSNDEVLAVGDYDSFFVMWLPNHDVNRLSIPYDYYATVRETFERVSRCGKETRSR